MQDSFHHLLCKSLPSSKAQAITLAESGLRSGCGGVKLDSQWKLLHTFHTPLRVRNSNRQPDFALFPVSVNPSSFAACALTVELQLPPLDTEHRGRCATYNTAMLEANPNRLFALSAATDLKSIMFLKSTRGTPSATVFELQHAYSDDLCYAPSLLFVFCFQLCLSVLCCYVLSGGMCVALADVTHCCHLC